MKEWGLSDESSSLEEAGREKSGTPSLLFLFFLSVFINLEIKYRTYKVPLFWGGFFCCLLFSCPGALEFWLDVESCMIIKFACDTVGPCWWFVKRTLIWTNFDFSREQARKKES